MKRWARALVASATVVLVGTATAQTAPPPVQFLRLDDLERRALKPPDLRDRKMMGEMAGSYWFRRVSEGGAVEPFRSMGSTMPAWKDELSVEDRWAVIAYQHTFSEHADVGMQDHAAHTPPAAAGGHEH